MKQTKETGDTTLMDTAKAARDCIAMKDTSEEAIKKAAGRRLLAGLAALGASAKTLETSNVIIDVKGGTATAYTEVEGIVFSASASWKRLTDMYLVYRGFPVVSGKCRVCNTMVHQGVDIFTLADAVERPAHVECIERGGGDG